MSPPKIKNRPVTCPPRAIRHVNDTSGCLLCKRRVLKEEAHWCCITCRRDKQIAQCQDDCTACEAMISDEVRRKALIKADKKRSFLLAIDNTTEQSTDNSVELDDDDEPLTAYHPPTSVKKKKSYARKSTGAISKVAPVKTSKGDTRKSTGSMKRKASTSSNSGSDSDAEEIEMKLDVKPLKFSTPRMNQRKTVSRLIKDFCIQDPYMKRLKDFEVFLLYDLNIDLPPHLVQDGFLMPDVPEELQLKFSVTKNELVRLISTSSVAHHLSGTGMTKKNVANDTIRSLLNANVDGLNEMFAALIKTKANALARIVFDIRSHVLSKMVCKDKNVIKKLVNAPLNPAVSFFGNLESLEKAVRNSKQNVLRLRVR